MNTFLYKEINYTKSGKRIAKKTWNSHQQLIRSLKHSLRLLEDEKIHIDKEKTPLNSYYSDIQFLTHQELLEQIEKDIEDKIKKFENIVNEDERKKLFKDFQNVKYSLSKKIPLELLELELEENNDAGTVLHNIVYKHKIKGLKSKDKRTLKTLENYISLSKNYFSSKQNTRKYNNQTLVKEVLFKIPEGQELTLNNDEWNTIIHNFKNEYFKDYDLYFYAIHSDEGTENKSHVHMFLSSYNQDNNDFDIQRNIFEFISKKYDLELDINNSEDHKIFMKYFQDDFYLFFNEQLKVLKKKERIEQKEYLTKDEIEQRLKIQSEDHLTIDERHTNLINQKILERIQEVKEPIKLINFKVSEKKSFFSNETTQKIEIETPTIEEKNKIVKAIKNYSNLGKFIKDLEHQNIQKDIKLFQLTQKMESDNRFFNRREDNLLEKIKTMENEKKTEQNEYYEKFIKLQQAFEIIKNILEKITNLSIKEVTENLENTIFEHLRKIERERTIELKKQQNEQFKNKNIKQPIHENIDL